ncbi:MAG: 3-hydroxyacyl-CoA dehydrogenase NAD-binding domain-containing protein [Acidimicrobiales bacterium]
MASPDTTLDRPIGKLGVIGAGLMGSGIAEVSARAGIDTIVIEASEEAAKAGRSRLEKSLDRAVKAGKMDVADQVKTSTRWCSPRRSVRWKTATW